MWFHTGRVVSYSRLVGLGLGCVTAGERQRGHRLRAWSFLSSSVYGWWVKEVSGAAQKDFRDRLESDTYHFHPPSFG